MSWAARVNDPPRIRGRAAQARRARVLARDPICVRCNSRPSTIADHIVNLAAGGPDTEENLQGLCVACHDRKTHEEAAIRRPSRKRATEAHPGALA